MKTRIITAVVLVAILIPVVLFGGQAFEILIGVAAIAGVFELLSICDRPKTRLYLYLVVGIYMLYATFMSSTILIDITAVIVFMLVLYACSMYDTNMSLLRLGYYFTGAVLISAGLHSILFLRLNYGYEYLIVLALATFGTDTGAYFAGRFFGKHKLNPRLSPKKTIEGSIGGMLLGTVLSICYGAYIHIEIPMAMLVVVCFILTITGQIGDLTFSSMKRTFEIKDFSQLLPGHGGILDRFDAFLFNGAVLGVLLYYVAMVA